MTKRKQESKVGISTRKQDWSPSLLPGQVVLVSTRSNQGIKHAYRKSWHMVASMSPPMLALGCRLSHRTAIDILETREFVVNIPSGDLADRLSSDPESTEWTFARAERIGAPRVNECRAHIECTLDSTKRINDEDLVFFGRIVNVTIDGSLLKGPPEQRYRALRLLFYLEKDLFTVLEDVRKPSS